MDSGPVTSDSMAPSRFGRELAARVRPRIVPQRRHVHRQFVGAVGRASLGFGRAVGRAQAIRPVVGLDNLNSFALRPPTGFWRDDEEIITTSSAQLAGPTQPGPAVHDAPKKPTWTDEFLQSARSSVPGSSRGASALRTPTLRAVEPANDFVPSGDPKLDALRRMIGDGLTPIDIARRTTSTTNPALPDFVQPREPAGSRRAPTDEVVSAGSVDARGDSADVFEPDADQIDGTTDGMAGVAAFSPSDLARGDTAAGESTGPGRFADRLRPQVLDELPAGSTAKGRSATGSSRSSRDRNAGPTEQRPGPPSSPGASEPARRSPSRGRQSGQAGVNEGSASSRRSRRRHPEPVSRVESLKRLLQERGDLPPGPGSGAAGDAENGGSARRASRPAVDQRGSGPDSSRRRDGAGDSAATNSAGSDSAATNSAGSDRQALRLQRMMSTDPGSTLQTAGPGIDVQSAPVSTSSSIDLLEASDMPSVEGSVATMGMRSSTPWVRPRPTLPGSVPTGQPIALRRLTLPRAMSAVHRPERDSGLERKLAQSFTRIEDGKAQVGVNSVDQSSVRAEASTRQETSTGPGTSAPGNASARPEIERGQRYLRRQSPTSVSVPLAPGIDSDRPAFGPGRGPTESGQLASVATSDGSPPGLSRQSVVPSGPGALLEVLRRVAIEDGETSTPTTEPAAPRAEALAERFMGELSTNVRRRPAPLPTQFRPMAEVITGGQQVMLSTDDASRRALRAVGKVAATTGNVIHIDRASQAGAQVSEVIAHELTHVAHPSPSPRFFDDIDHSPEEKRAEAVGRIMARSPLAPTASVVTPSAGPLIRRRASRSAAGAGRSVSGVSASSSAPGTLNAESLAAQVSSGISTSAPRSTSDQIIRRFESASPSRSGFTLGSHRGTSDSALGQPDQVGEAAQVDAGLSSEEISTRIDSEVNRRLDMIVRNIEDRMIIELERRGGRSWGRF